MSALRIKQRSKYGAKALARLAPDSLERVREARDWLSAIVEAERPR